jgi:tRNA A-37 threonylcarbamoyl transferase component Bud32
MEDLPPLGAPGQRLGRYELLQRIAVGGMAEVYRAYAVGPGDFRKLVAIKRLLPQHALDPQLLRMFLDESRLMARFAHPNLPHVLDVNDGAGQDVPFFVMEHVAGVDLREILRAARGPLPMEQVVALASGVAAGLHHAHELRGEDGRPLEIVHRDVSPSNVLVSFDGGVKVTDFGVAKWQQQKSFTYQGQLKGKFAHMSPEQCRAEPLDRRSDVFALGTLLYELATGHPPFQADSEFELLSRIVSEDAPRPRGPDGDIAPELAATIMRCLERQRERRFATAQDVQIALEAFAREQRLNVSPLGLASYVASLFAERAAAWRSAAGARLEAVPEKAPALPSVRTATDTFALEETLVSQSEERAVAAAGPPSEGSPARTAPRRRGAIVAMGAALLLLGLGSYAAFAPARPSLSAAAGASAPEATAPLPAPAEPRAVTTVVAATTVPSAEPPAPVVSRPAESPARAARSVRPPRRQKDSPRAATPATSEAAPTNPVAPPVSASAPVMPVEAARAAPVRSAAQPKVWDPDSPVPP